MVKRRYNDKSDRYPYHFGGIAGCGGQGLKEGGGKYGRVFPECGDSRPTRDEVCKRSHAKEGSNVRCSFVKMLNRSHSQGTARERRCRSTSHQEKGLGDAERGRERDL